MAKKQDKVKVSFVGMNAESVTGSSTLVETTNEKILFEFGLYQSNNLKVDYKINSRRLPFKPSEIDYIFVGHTHIDHIGALPRLYALGCKARIIVSKGSTPFMKELLYDCAHILNNDCITLNRKHDNNYTPIYEKDDVDYMLGFIDEFDTDIKYKLNDNISFIFTPSGHIINSCQTELFIKQNETTKSILYTSDLGNSLLNKPFTQKFKPVKYADLVISECTYADNKRKQGNKKNFEKDIEKIKAIIYQTCFQNKGNVLIPVFALDRSQHILKILYDIYGKDENFNIPIVVDSPLMCKIFNTYKDTLEDEELEIFEKMISWKNVKFCSETDESKSAMADKQPKIILSCSGMLNAGRSQVHLKNLLPSELNHIVLIGYCAEGTLGWKIQNLNGQKTLTIGGKIVKNKANITYLRSFSSHMQHDELLDYLSDIKTQKIALVHGNMDAKIGFKGRLEQRKSEKLNTGQVIAVNKSTTITL